MFKHKTDDGKRNLCGAKIQRLRQQLPGKVSQRQLAEMMQLRGVDMDKTAIRRIEIGERYVTDIELRLFCNIFSVSPEYLIGDCGE